MTIIIIQISICDHIIMYSNKMSTILLDTDYHSMIKRFKKIKLNGLWMSIYFLMRKNFLDGTFRKSEYSYLKVSTKFPH